MDIVRQEDGCFTFEEEAQIRLINLLGDTQQSYEYLNQVARYFHHHLRNTIDTDIKTGFIKNEIEKIEKHTSNLIDRLNLIKIEGKMIKKNTMHITRYPDPEYYSMGVCMESSKGMLGKVTLTGEITGFFLTDCVAMLEELNKRCIETKKELVPKRGSTSLAHATMNQFDLAIIHAYRMIFRGNPATTFNGAFCRSVRIFYGIAKFPSSNIQQRIIKVLKKYNNNRNFDTISGLHPNMPPPE